MKWDELKDMEIEYWDTGQEKTDIECPECGRHIYLNTRIVLTSYPSQYSYWCSCGWTGTSHYRWTGMERKEE